MTVVRRSVDASRSYVRGFEAGVEATLSYIAQQWPQLAESSDDSPGVTQATAEHMSSTVSLIRETLA